MARPQGFALIVAMIFLLVLTLIAVTAIRTASLEVRMAANDLMHLEAFAASATPRAGLGELLDAHVYHRGWPDALGGTLAGANQDFAAPEGLELCGAQPACGCNTADARNPAKLWYLGNEAHTAECGGSEPCPFNPARLCPDARYSHVVAGSPGTSGEYRVESALAVFKLRVDLAAGAGAAMASGYEGLGNSAGAGGGAIYFYAQGIGTDSTETAQAATSATYRIVIRN